MPANRPPTNCAGKSKINILVNMGARMAYGALRSASMNPRYSQSNSEPTDYGTRIAFQSVAFIPLAVILGERGWRLLRDLNRVYHFTGRG